MRSASLAVLLYIGIAVSNAATGGNTVAAEVSKATAYMIPIDNLWTMPRAVVELRPTGSVGLVRTKKEVNAALDVEQFSCYSVEKKENISGGVKAWSNQTQADRIRDGRRDTWWSPRAGDPLEQWIIELDLGRAVATRKVRLVFADTLNARPFERFRIYISEGAYILTGQDVVKYSLLARQALPNRKRVVEYPVVFKEQEDTTRTGAKLERSLDFDLVRFVRVVLDAKLDDESAMPALAEIEIDALGDNIALNTINNGGSIDAHYAAIDAPKMFDGDAGTYWYFPPVTDDIWDRQPGTPGGGAWFEWDLGAVYWIDEFFLTFGALERYGTMGGGDKRAVPGYIMLTSDGTPRPGGTQGDIPTGKFDYQLLAQVNNLENPYQWHFYHPIEPRRVRYIFFRVAYGYGNYGRGKSPLYEMQMFGEGYPAAATLTSPPISIAKIAGRQGAKVISALRWEAEQEYPAARAEIKTRTGDTLDTLRTYFRTDGREVTESQYNKLPKSQRGKIEETFTPGEQWSNWSSAYAQLEGPFLSPSPCLFVQFQIKLISERADVAPVLNRLSLDLAEPLVSEVTGAVEPREVMTVDQPVRYLYRLWPAGVTTDPGFDQVIIKAPVINETPLLKLNGMPAEPDSVKFRGDSLWVWLPRTVKTDSLTVEFTARLSRNGVSFDACVGNSSQPDIWQTVAPAAKGATSIFLPVLAEEDALIGNLEINPNILTPNGDGINDQIRITFSVLKVQDKAPEVAVYDLSGILVKNLNRSLGQEETYLWDGRAESGQMVCPGIYLCRIQLRSDEGIYNEERTVGVVY